MNIQNAKFTEEDPVKIDRLLSGIPVITSREERGNIDVSGLAYHSGKVKKGDLFFCIRGYKTDGHLYLKDALAGGAVAAVVEEFVDDCTIPQYKVDDSRQALAEIAAFFYDHPSRNFKLTGITATNGKTSTTYMTNAIFEEAGFQTGMIGTVVIKTGNLIRAAELTTPESLDLQKYFSEMVKNRVTHAVMEVSSSGLELKRVWASDFDYVVLNNISREHLDLHGSFSSYFNAKASLIRSAGPEKWAVLNLDCPFAASLAGETRAKTLTYGLKNQSADIGVHDLDLSSGRAKFKVEIKNKIDARIFSGQPDFFTIELSVLGLHSVYNAMAASLIGLLHQIPVQTIQQALKKFQGVERRFQLIFDDNFKVIDDHFANSGNIDVTLETLQMMAYKDVHLVYAIRGSRGTTVNRENAEAIARWAPKIGLKKVIATTSSSHVGEKDFVTEEELAVYREVMQHRGVETEIFTELPEAIEKGLSEAKEEDILLLAGCQGMDYGASLCLQMIHKTRPDLPGEKIFAVLRNRVAGV